MNLKITFPAFALLIFAITCRGQSSIRIPKEFVQAPIPKVGSDEWYALNNSHNEFGVSIINNKIDIKKVREVHRHNLAIEGGTLIGIDRGEWGGQLSYKPDDTTKKAVDIKRGNIKFIFKFKGKIYFIEGLAHMGYSGGAIYELNTTNKNFTATKLVDFDDAPQAFAIYNGKLLIATYENFYIIEDFKKELFFKATFWSGLYPNSIAVVDNKNVFLGIRSGIVKLDLTTKTIKYYRYTVRCTPKSVPVSSKSKT